MFVSSPARSQYSILVGFKSGDNLVTCPCDVTKDVSLLPLLFSVSPIQGWPV